MSIIEEQPQPRPEDGAVVSEGKSTEFLDQEQETSWGERATYGAAAVLVAVELGPANEGIRGFAGVAAEVTVANPTVTTAVVASGTLALEAGAGIAAAHLLGTRGGRKMADWVKQKAVKFGIGSEGNRKTGIVSNLVLGATAGSAVTVFANQVRDPERTVADNVKLAVANSAAVSLGIAPLVYGVSKTAETVGWENVGLGALVAAGVAAGIHKVRKWRRDANAEQTDEATAEPTQERKHETAAPRYDLSKEELAAIDADLVDRVQREVGKRVCAVWLRSDDPRANALRTREAETFPEMPEIMKDLEGSSGFLAIVDARRGVGDGRIVRGTRVTGPMYRDDPENGSPYEDNGLVKGLVESGQITAEEIGDYYTDSGLDLAQTASIESNLRIGDRAPRVKGIPLAYLAYLAMVRRSLGSDAIDGTEGSLVAFVNDATVNSFKRLGIEHQLFAGRDDLRTPTAGGVFDEKYVPVVYTATPKARRTFRYLDRFALAELEL